MRTNIVIEEKVMEEAAKYSTYKTKKDIVNEALKLLIKFGQQEEIRKMRGKLHWEGDLQQMRHD